MRIRHLIALFAIFTSSAHADWQQEYRYYQQALATGDGQAALAHARSAWQSARDVLGPGENRAVLAQNYVTMAMFSDNPEEALVPLEDAVALAQQGFGIRNYDLSTLIFFGDYARSAAAPGNHQKANAAYQSGVEVSSEMVGTPHAALAFRLLALRLMELETHDRAYVLMTRLIDRQWTLPNFRKSQLKEDMSIRMFAAISGVPIADAGFGNLRPTTGRREYTDRLETTLRDWRRLSRLYPWQTSIDSFDPELGEVIVSERLIAAFYRSFASNTRVDPFLRSLPQGRYGIAREQTCPTIVHTRRNLRFPSTASGYNGAVLIGYHFGADGKVLDATLISEVPSDRFGSTALKQVKRFRAETDGVDPICLRNQIISVEFYTEPN